MSRAEILSEIKQAEEEAKKFILANEARNKEDKRSESQSREI